MASRRTPRQVFKEITNAHVTLSDATERAWYDAHRDQILRGGDGSPPRPRMLRHPIKGVPRS